MREVGQLAASLLAYLAKQVRPGISTGELDRLAAIWTKEAQATSAPLGYVNGNKAPFPAHICTSVNNMVCHGIPSDDVILYEGDIINIDVTPIFNGYYGDTSKTFPVGNCSSELLDLIATTEECLSIGIRYAIDGNYLGSLGNAIEEHARSKGYSIIREFGGHGIGRVFHTSPFIPHYGIPHTGLKLKAGMIFTIEPILCRGEPRIKFINDWEAVTVSGQSTAQAEHTILVGTDSAEILTNESSRESIS
jgi:methionyl aminopeptidase